MTVYVRDFNNSYAMRWVGAAKHLARRCFAATLPARRYALRTQVAAPRCVFPQQLEKQLEAADISIEEHGGRITVMEEHLKNVRQEIAYTESRVSGVAGQQVRVAYAGQVRSPSGTFLKGVAPHVSRRGGSMCGCHAWVKRLRPNKTPPRLVWPQVDVERKEVETESHLRIMAEKELVRRRSTSACQWVMLVLLAQPWCPTALRA